MVFRFSIDYTGPNKFATKKFSRVVAATRCCCVDSRLAEYLPRTFHKTSKMSKPDDDDAISSGSETESESEEDEDTVRSFSFFQFTLSLFPL